MPTTVPNGRMTPPRRRCRNLLHEGLGRWVRDPGVDWTKSLEIELRGRVVKILEHKPRAHGDQVSPGVGRWIWHLPRKSWNHALPRGSAMHRGRSQPETCLRRGPGIPWNRLRSGGAPETFTS